jgi:hypothetical protein
MSEADVRKALRDWLTKTAAKKKRAGQPLPAIADDTLLIEQGVISSLKLMELVLYIGELKGTPVDTSMISAPMLGSIDAIYKSFFSGEQNAD